jgi:hypothetical protein
MCDVEATAAVTQFAADKSPEPEAAYLQNPILHLCRGPDDLPAAGAHSSREPPQTLFGRSPGRIDADSEPGILRQSESKSAEAAV